jgi:glucarate dehydratase
MKITSIVVHRVNVPLETAYRWSTGQYFGASKAILEVETDEGIVGLGEVPVELAPAIETSHTPRLIGADPMDVEDCMRRCVPEFRALLNTHDATPLRAFGGIELGLWDIRGKALGLPVYMLLGGLARSEVLFSEYFALRLPSGLVAGEATALEVARYCANMRERHGSTIFEGKVGVGTLSEDLALVREVRAAIGPDCVLRLDANMAWPVSTARAALRALAGYDIANIEDPTSGIRAMAKLRAHSDIPFSSHIADVPLAVEHGVPDAIVLNLINLGGIRETIKFISACELAGIGFWFYSGDAGIGTAGYLQVSAALRYLERPHQSLLRWYTDDVIAGGPFRPERDVLAVPTGPGLGVELDRQALARCEAHFEQFGVMNQLGAPAETRYTWLARQ